ncbi:MAG: SDR family oxidoreductase [Verrucomicrobia bacterium]|nr:SDR family oxidoreductase [Verrucomicrobiota bacterium]
MKNTDTSGLSDPRHLHPKPPFPQGEIASPGLERELKPKADHGESSYRGAARLAGRKALITGGDSGIGRAVALAFAREGASVALSFLASEKEDAAITLGLIEEAGQRCLLLPGDLAQPAHCRELVRRTAEEFGGLDLLVNNAAYQRTFDSLADIPEGEFERTFAINLFAMFYLTQAALPIMPAGSSIVNSASIQSYDPGESLLPYATSKSAIASFTKATAAFAIERGVRINAVAPGPVWTPLIPSTMPAERASKFGADSLFGRPAQPAELAPVYVFLASHAASYVTGEVYGVTGGRIQL